jgi:hypothetical protein
MKNLLIFLALGAFGCSTTPENEILCPSGMVFNSEVGCIEIQSVLNRCGGVTTEEKICPNGTVFHHTCKMCVDLENYQEEPYI